MDWPTLHPWPGALWLGGVLAVLLLFRRGWASVLLGGLVCAPALLLQPAGTPSCPERGPALLLGLLAPDLFPPHAGAPLAGDCLRSLGAGSWPTGLVFSVGLPGLLLGLFGLACARDPAVWVGRGLLLLAAIPLSGLAPGLPLPGPSLLLAALGLGAGSALASLYRREKESATMLLAWVSIGLAASLAWMAISAGAAPDARALAPWLPSGAPPGPAQTALLARALRAVLDRAALSACASMFALLVFLRHRGAWGSALLLLAALADATRPWWLD